MGKFTERKRLRLARIVASSALREYRSVLIALDALPHLPAPQLQSHFFPPSLSLISLISTSTRTHVAAIAGPHRKLQTSYRRSQRKGGTSNQEDAGRSGVSWQGMCCVRDLPIPGSPITNTLCGPSMMYYIYPQLLYVKKYTECRPQLYQCKLF